MTLEKEIISRCPLCNKNLIGISFENCYIIRCEKCKKEKIYNNKKEAFINPKKGFYE